MQQSTPEKDGDTEKRCPENKQCIYTGSNTLAVIHNVNILPEKNYYFRVYARNSVGISSSSDASGPVMIQCTPPQKPDAPFLSIREGNRVMLSWKPPPDSGNEILNYTVTIRDEFSNF